MVRNTLTIALFHSLSPLIPLLLIRAGEGPIALAGFLEESTAVGLGGGLGLACVDCLIKESIQTKKKKVDLIILRSEMLEIQTQIHWTWS